MPALPLGLAPAGSSRCAAAPRTRLGRPERHAEPRRLRPHRSSSLTAAIGAAAALRLYIRCDRQLRPARARPRPRGLRGACPPPLRRRRRRRRGRARARSSPRSFALYADGDRRALAAGPRRAARGRGPGDGPRLERALGAHPAPGQGRPGGAGLGLVVQRLALGLGPGASGSGHIQLVASRTGAPAATGGFCRRPGPAAPAAATRPLRADATPPAPPRRRSRRSRPRRSPRSRPPPRAPPPASATPTSSSSCSTTARSPILDAARSRRNARAAVRIAVDLANAGASPAPRRCCASSRAA